MSAAPSSDRLVHGDQLGAIGECGFHLHVRDHFRHAFHHLILHDAVRLAGDIARLLSRPAIGAGAGAVATLVYVAPDAEERVTALRTALDGAEAGASAWDGMLLARLLAPDAAGLRRMVTGALAVLRGTRNLPRIWRC